MKLVAALTLALLSLGTSLSRQGSDRPEARLVHRYESRCGYSCAQELAIDLGGVYGNHPSDTVAVRFCSKEPLPVALSTSAAAFAYVITILQGSYGYTSDRVFFLRAEDCAGADKAVTATEFWVVPSGAALPTSVETIRSNQARIDSLGPQGMVGNARSYRAVLLTLRTELRAHPGLVGVVVGYYYKQPSLVIKRRLRDAKKMLEESGLSPDRYFIRVAPWSGEQAIDPPDPEPKYPTVFVIDIAKGSNAAQR